MLTIDAFAELATEAAEWRHDLHANPELLYDVHRTAAFVAAKLNAFGCHETVGGIGKPEWWASLTGNPAPPAA